MTFEAPPERLAAGRLHLPKPPGMDYKDMNIWHFGHTADPLYMGICTVCFSLRFVSLLFSLIHFCLFVSSPFSDSLLFMLLSLWRETDSRVRRVRAGTVAMRWKQPVIQEWNVYMIQ